MQTSDAPRLDTLARGVKRADSKCEKYRKRVRKWDERGGELVTDYVRAKALRGLEDATDAQERRYLAVCVARRTTDDELHARQLSPDRNLTECWRFRRDSQLPVHCVGADGEGCALRTRPVDEVMHEYDGYYESVFDPQLAVCAYCYDEPNRGEELIELSWRAHETVYGQQPISLRQLLHDEDRQLAPEEPAMALWRATRPGPPDQWRAAPAGLRLRCVVRECAAERAEWLLVGRSQCALCERHMKQRATLGDILRAALSAPSLSSSPLPRLRLMRSSQDSAALVSALTTATLHQSDDSEDDQ